MLEHGETSVVVLKRNRRTCALVVAILSLHAAMLAWGGLRHSITLDEVAHLPAGMSHWTFGRFDLFCVNPPLVRMAAAVPVLFSGAEIDWGRYDLRPWTRSEFAVGIRFVELNGEASFWYYTLGRWACIPFSLLGGWVCFRWARELYGDAAGLTALVLWCFCPNVLGHAQLVTPDAGAAALGISAAYLFWRWLKRPNWGRAFLSGAALGAAQLTKFTWLPLFLLWPLMWLAWRWSQRRQGGRSRWLRIGRKMTSAFAPRIPPHPGPLPPREREVILRPILSESAQLALV
ncbi:MAG: glycosyltransferase family 39 protein, partial [Thermoguttaceae bacterium]|nr:glycosyltransferase family 39 protein [Thermoguttaceae bacterium]